MEIRLISEEISVSPQITADDVSSIAQEGFKSIICNRPDGESVGQPGFGEIEAAAKNAGLEIRYLPVIAGKIQNEDAQEFGVAVLELPKPVLAYCRSGTRSAVLWSLSQVGHKSTDEIIQATKNAGYDMKGVV